MASLFPRWPKSTGTRLSHRAMRCRRHSRCATDGPTVRSAICLTAKGCRLRRSPPKSDRAELPPGRNQNRCLLNLDNSRTAALLDLGQQQVDHLAGFNEFDLDGKPVREFKDVC